MTPNKSEANMDQKLHSLTLLLGLFPSPALTFLGSVGNILSTLSSPLTSPPSRHLLEKARDPATAQMSCNLWSALTPEKLV